MVAYFLGEYRPGFLSCLKILPPMVIAQEVVAAFPFLGKRESKAPDASVVAG